MLEQTADDVAEAVLGEMDQGLPWTTVEASLAPDNPQWGATHLATRPAAGARVTARALDLVQLSIEGRKLPPKTSTTVDATLINAPNSTKSVTQARDPEIPQTMKDKPSSRSPTAGACLRNGGLQRPL